MRFLIPFVVLGLVALTLAGCGGEPTSDPETTTVASGMDNDTDITRDPSPSDGGMETLLGELKSRGGAAAATRLRETVEKLADGKATVSEADLKSAIQWLEQLHAAKAGGDAAAVLAALRDDGARYAALATTVAVGYATYAIRKEANELTDDDRAKAPLFERYAELLDASDE